MAKRRERRTEAIPDPVERVARGIHEALQDPTTDVPAAIAPLRGCFDPLSPMVLALVDALLYHGHGGALLELLLVVLAPLRRDFLEAVIDGHDLREIALALLIDERVAGTRDAKGVVAIGRRVCGVGPGEIARQIARRRGEGVSLDPARYRFDVPGVELVPALDDLLLRFRGWLVEHGWPPSRAHLACQEVEAVALGHAAACRLCALGRQAQRDRGDGATVLAFDGDDPFKQWEVCLEDIGGPWRCAALLEGLPAWMEFLVAAGLVPGEQGRAVAAQLTVEARKRAGDLTARCDDRALAHAVERLRGAAREQ